MTDTKSGEVVSALVTAAVSGSILAHGQADAGLLSVSIMREWCVLAAVTSIAYLLAILLRHNALRSVARFWSGCAWGAIVLVCLWQAELRPLLLCAIALFGFDFYAVFKGEKWQKSNCSASANG